MSQNPLKQYFRRPAIYLKLPSNGKFYPAGCIDIPPNGELPVYPMTAVDEITSRTPDALFNGTAVVNIIQSCVPGIKDAWQVTSVDLDAILIAIRIATSGDEMDIDTKCPKCGEEHRYGFSLVKLLGSMRDVNYDSPLKVRELEIHFKPLSYAETNKNNIAQYELQRMMAGLQDMTDDEQRKALAEKVMKKLNESMNNIVAGTIAGIRTPEEMVTEKQFIYEFLENCDRATNNAIKDHSINLKEQNTLRPLEMTCSSCSHQYQQPLILNVSDFFD